MGSLRASNSVSEIAEKLKKMSSLPNTGRSPLIVFGLYGSNQRMLTRLSWSVRRQRSGIGTVSFGSSGDGGGTCEGSMIGMTGSSGRPIGRCCTMRSSGTGPDGAAAAGASPPAGAAGGVGRASMTPGVASTAKFGLTLPSTRLIHPVRPSDSDTRYHVPRRALPSTRVPCCNSATTGERVVASAYTVTFSAYTWTTKCESAGAAAGAAAGRARCTSGACAHALVARVAAASAIAATEVARGQKPAQTF